MLSALVVVAGLGFGREVVQWWRSETLTPSDGESPLLVPNALGDPGLIHDLQFGDLPWQFGRQSLAGPQEVAVKALREICRRSVLDAVPNEDLPGPAESKLLARLRHSKPVEEELGKWQLYELAGQFPMVAVVREITEVAGQGSRAAQPASLNPDGSQDPHVAPGARRVVTWGLAVPTGEQTWNLYTFAATGKSQTVGAGLPEVVCPPDSRRILSLRAAGGGAMVSFQGNVRPEQWQHFFDDWFQQRGWTSEAPWPSSGPAWHRRYTSAAEPSQGFVEVHFRRDSHGQLTGLLIINRPANDSR